MTKQLTHAPLRRIVRLEERRDKRAVLGHLSIEHLSCGHERLCRTSDGLPQRESEHHVVGYVGNERRCMECKKEGIGVPRTYLVINTTNSRALVCAVFTEEAAMRMACEHFDLTPNYLTPLLVAEGESREVGR